MRSTAASRRRRPGGDQHWTMVRPRALACRRRLASGRVSTETRSVGPTAARRLPSKAWRPSAARGLAAGAAFEAAAGARPGVLARRKQEDTLRHDAEALVIIVLLVIVIGGGSLLAAALSH